MWKNLRIHTERKSTAIVKKRDDAVAFQVFWQAGAFKNFQSDKENGWDEWTLSYEVSSSHACLTIALYFF